MLGHMVYILGHMIYIEDDMVYILGCMIGVLWFLFSKILIPLLQNSRDEKTIW